MKRYWIPIFIILLGVVLRTYEFGTNPSGVYLDEASHGYSAYSLLLTGRDEYGKAWPILFRSFGTYPPGLYNYLSVLPIKVLGLNAVSVRVTSLVMGIILVILCTFFVSHRLGLVVAITPIFIFVSRAAFEPNLGLVILFLGLILFLRKNNYLSVLFLSLSAYAYPSERFLSVVLLLLLFRRNWRLILFGLILQLPLFLISFTPAGSGRFQSLSGGNPIRLYLAYFSPDNLFSKPDPDLQRSYPELSVFYWWMVVPLVLGLIKFYKKPNYLLLTLILVSPIPGAITKDYFSTLRVLPLFLGLAWIISLGWPKNKFINLLLIFAAVAELYSNQTLLKNERSTVWNTEYISIARFIREHPNDHFVLDNSRVGPSYILIAFHNSVDPTVFQSKFDRTWQDNYYSHTESDNNIDLQNTSVRPIFWQDDVYKEQYLIGDLLAVSKDQIAEHKLIPVAPYIYRTDPKAKGI